ncbi:MAG: sensor domain-containing diguanylate cyclase [Deltaproteobacteria bacterium]|nr:sensor domain-containing diguanylate cyclase [Deltaproteobacteria bacterium]
MIRVLNNKRLLPFLARHMQMVPQEPELRLDTFLRLALAKADEFVPSESGSIFLDDPAIKMLQGSTLEPMQLAAVAAFGSKSGNLLGKRISVGRGIVGRVYTSGQACYSRDVRKDPHFAAEFDKMTGNQTRSVLCVPIQIRESTIGVLELINKKGRKPYTPADFDLLKIFADYISASIQNFLDAKRNAERAKRDNLTGLFNDRQLFDVMNYEVLRAWRRGLNLGLLFLDLDGFKEVNDEHGHLAGSRVLMEVAEVLRQTVRQLRAELARYGGDEYVVVLPGAGLAESVEVADRIRRAVERTIFLSQATDDVAALQISDQITTSIGVACLKENVGSAIRGANGRVRASRAVSLLIKAADAAMYRAKRAGKNQVVVAQGKTAGVAASSDITQ